ncbi:hypothetical protein WAX78_18205 [Bacillus sp. FJAT-53711]|uniref:Major facilitator superfamily (MFS) profile domain-containing protein n=1 Tax=Bacillus yunxiaonensis TaxID=3127665 RepID=A0ABU8FZC5_9BACI
MVFSDSVFNLITPKLTEEFAVSASKVSLVISLEALSFGISTIIFTTLCDNVSMRKLVLYPSIAIPLIAILAIFADQSFGTLLSFRVLMVSISLATIIFLKVLPKVYNRKAYNENETVEKKAQ